MSESITTVTNPVTGETILYSIPPDQAVIAAYASEHGDFNTWDYDKRYRKYLLEFPLSYACGNWTAPKKGKK